MVVGYSGFVITGEPIYKLIVLLSVPIFSYLLVEGFDNTKNRKKYIFRLWITALGIQILYTIGMDTFRLNGIFGIIASYFLIDRLERGEWYWVHTFVILLMILPIEYGSATVGLSTLYYVIKHKKEFKNRSILTYFQVCLILPLFIVDGGIYTLGLIAIKLLQKKLKNRKYISAEKNKNYAVLIICYVVVAVIRFTTLSYK